MLCLESEGREDAASGASIGMAGERAGEEAAEEVGEEAGGSWGEGMGRNSFNRHKVSSFQAYQPQSSYS